MAREAAAKGRHQQRIVIMVGQTPCLIAHQAAQLAKALTETTRPSAPPSPSPSPLPHSPPHTPHCDEVLGAMDLVISGNGHLLRRGGRAGEEGRDATTHNPGQQAAACPQDTVRAIRGMVAACRAQKWRRPALHSQPGGHSHWRARPAADAAAAVAGLQRRAWPLGPA